MNEDLDLSQFTPEGLQQILGLAGLNEQNDLLRQQLEQANALRSAGIAQYSDPQAQAVGGIASMATKMAGILGGVKTEQERCDTFIDFLDMTCQVFGFLLKKRRGLLRLSFTALQVLSQE